MQIIPSSGKRSYIHRRPNGEDTLVISDSEVMYEELFITLAEEALEEWKLLTPRTNK